MTNAEIGCGAVLRRRRLQAMLPRVRYQLSLASKTLESKVHALVDTHLCADFVNLGLGAGEPLLLHYQVQIQASRMIPVHILCSMSAPLIATA